MARAAPFRTFVNAAALIAIDWGTTRARAYRMDRNGRVLGERTEPLGIQQLGGLGFPDALSRLLGDWDGDAVPRLACGMVGSRQGWREAPYVECPASLESLARGLVETVAGGLAIVPGLATRDAAGVPDVMRGEETQLWGAGLAEGEVAVLPGTHSKWAWTGADGAVLQFQTHMTGELFAVLREHSILGRLMPAGVAEDPAAFERGVRLGLSSPAGLLHTLFAARTNGLMGLLPAEGLGDFLSGILIGAEIAGATATRRPAAVTLIGGAALCARYATALGLAGMPHRLADDDVTTRGQWQLARAAALMEDPT